jgi:hypothetical protein
MKIFALCNSNGFVEQISHSPYDNIVEGQLHNGLIAHELPIGENPNDVLKNWYWSDDCWNIRGAHPTKFHFWNVEQKIWELDNDTLLAYHKQQRNQLLQSTDFTQLADAPFTEQQKKDYATYRNALRNMTEDDYLIGNFPKFTDTIS